jgi:hypothetical protein
MMLPRAGFTITLIIIAMLLQLQNAHSLDTDHHI